MQNELIQYVRNRKNQRVGVVLATTAMFEGKVQIGIGWSMAKTKMDTFDKERGLQIARGRAKEGTSTQVPRSIDPLYRQMINRAVGYWKEVPLRYTF